MPKFGEKSTHGNNRRITKQQQDFLDNYVHKDMTQTASARACGYANPTVDAVRLLNRPIIQERLEEMRQELENIRDKALSLNKFGDAIRAEELRLKATGLLVNKSHVQHENIDNMNREQLLEKLGDFMKIAQERMKDVTPEEKEPILIVEDNTVQ